MFKTTPYVIALYIRLSIEDSKVESLSIENQKIALHKYADEMGDVHNVEVTEYIDNGFSGTNFERPAVQELLDAVRFEFTLPLPEGKRYDLDKYIIPVLEKLLK